MLRKECMDILEKRKTTHKFKRFLEYKIKKRELTGNNTATPDKNPVKDDTKKKTEEKSKPTE